MWVFRSERDKVKSQITLHVAYMLGARVELWQSARALGVAATQGLGLFGLGELSQRAHDHRHEGEDGGRTMRRAGAVVTPIKWACQELRTTVRLDTKTLTQRPWTWTQRYTTHHGTNTTPRTFRLV